MRTSQLFTLILLVGLFAMSVREANDPDLWWHLRAGQFILETGAIPHSDPFSFTAQGKEWITHEWLSEVILYELYHLGGPALLSVSAAAAITLAFALVYSLSPGRPYLAGFALVLGALATAPTWGARPQILSFLFMSALLWLLDRYLHTRQTRLLWPVPFLMGLWVNLHSGYALGLVVLGAYVIGGAAESLVHNGAAAPGGGAAEGPAWSSRMLRELIGVLALALLAVLVNPNGARMFVYPFETLTSAAMQRYIQEWFSPDLHQTEWLPFALLLAATLGSALLGRARVRLAQSLLVVVFSLAALRSVRHIPLFVLVAVPVLATQLAALIPPRSREASGTRAIRVLNLVIASGVVLAALARVGGVLSNQGAAERARFPVAAVEWITANHPAANLYNSYGWGGYLIWRLYPEYRVFIDGRADVYGDAFIEQYLSVYRAEPGWEEELERRAVRLVLVEPDAPLAKALSKSPGARWRRAFADTESVVYVAQ